MKLFVKRVLAILLSLIMVISLFTIVPITASAETKTVTLKYYLTFNETDKWTVTTEPHVIYLAEYADGNTTTATGKDTVTSGKNYSIITHSGSRYVIMYAAALSSGLIQCGASKPTVEGSYSNDSHGIAHLFTITETSNGTYTIKPAHSDVKNYYVSVSDTAVSLSTEECELHIDSVSGEGVYIYYQVTTEVAASDPNTADTYDIIAACDITSEQEAQNDDPSLMYDNNLTTTYNKNSAGEFTIIIALPEGVTFRGIRALFEHDSDNLYYLGRTIDVKVETSTDDGSSYSDWDPVQTATYLEGYKKVLAKEDGLSGITHVKITLNNGQYNGNYAGFWPGFAEMQVYADPPEPSIIGDSISELSVKALYKSQKIEWTVNDSNDGAAYTVQKKHYNSDEDWKPVTSAPIYYNGNVSNTTDHVTVAGKDYYTVLDEVGTHTNTSSSSDRDLYIYQIVRTVDGSAETVGTVYAFENTSIAALRRNAIVSAYYGREGRRFGNETIINEDGTQTTVTHPADNLELDDIKLAKLKALKYGTMGSVQELYKANTTSGAMNKIFSATSATRENFLKISASASAKGYRAQLGKSGMQFDATNAKDPNVADGEVHSIAISMTSEIALFRVDGVNTPNENQFKNDYAPLLSNDITGVTIGGNSSGGDLFNGIIYNFFISEETYSLSGEGNIDELNTVCRVPKTIELKEKLDDAWEHLDNYSGFYSDASESLYENALKTAENYLSDLDNGFAYEDGAQTHINAVNAAYDRLKLDYIKVTVEAGSGADAKKITITHNSDSEPESYANSDGRKDQNYVIEDGNVAYFGHDTTHSVTVSIENGAYEAYADGLTFAGWYVNDQFETDQTTCTVEVSANTNIVAKFTGFNGDPGDNSLIQITDYKMLQRNASANSWRETPAWGTDGKYTYAFDGYTSVVNGSIYRWHSNYSDNQTTADSESPIIHLAGDRSNCIWIQSGFDDEDPSTDDSRLIGGIAYWSSGSERIKDYEVWVSDYENMGAYVDENGVTRYNPYTVVAKNTFGSETGEHKVLFENGPVQGKYVRLVAYSSYTANNYNYASADEVQIFEYIGNEGTVNVTLKTDVNEPNDTTLGTIPVDGHYVLPSLYAKATADQVEAAIMDPDFDDEIFDNISTNYIIEPDTINNNIVHVDSKTATYHLTINDNGTPHEDDRSYGKTFDGYMAKDPNGFKYWYIEGEEGGQNIIVSTIATVNYLATENMTITAEYTETAPGIAAYIPAPKVSRLNDRWVVEVPVNFINAVDKESGTPIDEITEAGLILVDKGKNYDITQQSALSDQTVREIIIGGTNRDGVTILSLGKFDNTNKIKLSNKGRYLHTFTTKEIPERAVYAYIIYNGNIYVSNVQTLEAKSKIAATQ